MQRFSKDPRVTRARFNSKCTETGKQIKKGDECIYYPTSKSVFHLESNQAVDYANWLQDCSFGNEY
ncbi:MAG: hypothetical protein HN356_15070 [Calditrichaeota bacterium]|jgi:hypothetical protein|nr:hypothetical protein [Calditrichota bacterium]